MAMALDGVKVLELASFWAAPTAGMLLAEHGAEVIKVESPMGDESRRFTSREEHGNESPSFLVVNRNKRGMVVDLRTPEGREIVRKLALRSDVLVHNYRMDAAERMGLRYEDLEALNPGLIYVHVSAYGKNGPMARHAGYDVVCQGLAGMMHRQMPDGTPIGPGIFATDGSAGIMLAYGVALALLARHRTGRGQMVETSLLQMAIAIQHVELVRLEMDRDVPRPPSDRPVIAKPYRCADGQWVLPVPVGDKQWAGLCRVMGDSELTANPQCATHLLRQANAVEICARLAEIFATRSRDQWLRRLEEEDVPCSPIVARHEVFDQPQVIANGMSATVDHPAVGRAEMTAVPLSLSATPGGIRRPSPMQGQHTVEVLRELGYSAAEIDALLKARVATQA